jgi:hypothetical protein
MSTFAPPALPQVAAPDPTKHVKYNLGMVLGVADFEQDFTYHSARDARIVRDLLGYGVVSGLHVTVETGERGPLVQVAPGEAVTPSGRLVCVTPAQCAYVNDWLEGHRHEVEEVGFSPPSTLPLSVVACYRDCPTDDVPIPGEPCRSDDELMQPSRLMDSFALDLRLRPPPQLEEDAVRDFVAWLRRIPLVDGPLGDVEAFLEEIRQAAALEGSPPVSPPGLLDFLLGSPPAPLAIPRAYVAEYLEGLFRLWVEELRPRLRSAIPSAECGCGGTVEDLDPDSDCVLLAGLEVPLALDAPSGNWVVADTPPVFVDRSRRPTLLHLRLLQEWMLGGPGAVGPDLVASGRVHVDGTVAASAGGLTATALEKTLFVLRFPGFDVKLEHVVLGDPVASVADAQASTFEVLGDYSPAQDGIVVRVKTPSGDPVPDGFMVRIEQLGGVS